MKHLLMLFVCAGPVFCDGQLIAGLSVNGSAQAVAAPGWPWIVSVAAFDVTGAEQPMPAGAVVEVAGADVMLTRHASLPIWTLPPGTDLKEGTYRVELRVAGLSRFAQIEIVKETGPGARELVFSWWFAFQGEPEKALGEVEAWIAKEPSSVAARVRQAEILESLDRRPEAIAALEEADKLHRQGPNAKIRPVGIRRFLERLMGGPANN